MKTFTYEELTPLRGADHPPFSAPDLDIADGRVRILTSGKLAFAKLDADGVARLYSALVVLDTGGNVLTRRTASEGGCAGIAAPFQRAPYHYASVQGDDPIGALDHRAAGLLRPV